MILRMTAAAAVTLPAVSFERCPTPEQIDRLVVEFCQLESEVDAAYAAGSDAVIRGEQLSDRLQAAYVRCFIEKPRTPSLKVRVK